MSQTSLRFRVPDIKFRVLIVGRANAGKTSILQRVCETTESPKIYRIIHGGREEIRLDPTTERGNHDIEDELVFTNHDGYVFHDSCGFEAGNEAELQTVQNFVRKKATARRLRDRLHAIWYCVPMENDRPMLDMKFFGTICPDKNVPVIAVFTKYDQFRRDVRIKLRCGGGSPTAKDVDGEVEKIFQEQYWNVVKDESPRCVRLENMHKGGRCDTLITETSNALSTNVATLMLLAVQRGNLEMSVKMAMGRTSLDGDHDGVSKVKSCTKYFPHLWLFGKSSFLLELDDFDDELESFLSDEEEDEESESLDERLKYIIAQISSILGKDGLDILDNCHPAHHTLLVSTMLLECATMLYTCSDATLDAALQEAFSRLTSYYPALQGELSSLSPESTKEEYIAFVLEHRLTVSQ